MIFKKFLCIATLLSITPLHVVAQLDQRVVQESYDTMVRDARWTRNARLLTTAGLIGVTGATLWYLLKPAAAVAAVSGAVSVPPVAAVAPVVPAVPVSRIRRIGQFILQQASGIMIMTGASMGLAKVNSYVDHITEIRTLDWFLKNKSSFNKSLYTLKETAARLDTQSPLLAVQPVNVHIQLPRDKNMDSPIRVELKSIDQLGALAQTLNTHDALLKLYAVAQAAQVERTENSAIVTLYEQEMGNALELFMREMAKIYGYLLFARDTLVSEQHRERVTVIIERLQLRMDDIYTQSISRINNHEHVGLLALIGSFETAFDLSMTQYKIFEELL